MCGIVGAVAQRDVAEILVEGLRRLEYRGYDSAGVAVFSANQPLQRVRRLGKVAELAKALEEQSVHGGTGIARTRWASRSPPSAFPRAGRCSARCTASTSFSRRPAAMMG